MKAYKLEILVIDHENMGEECIRHYIENAKYINPQISNIVCADIGKWSDDHPLNKCETCEAEYNRIFNFP